MLMNHRRFVSTLTLGAGLLALVTGQSARAAEIFNRNTANAEGWASYSASYTATQTGNYILGFNILSSPTNRDSTIFLDQVKVQFGVTTLFESGFESPFVIPGQTEYPAVPVNAGTAVFGDWTYTNYSGIINGNPGIWGTVGAYAGNQRGFVQTYQGVLSNIATTDTIALVAGETYTVSFVQASRPGIIGDEGRLNYNVTLNQVVNAPDGGVGAALFGSALLGLAALRRRFGS